jgi:hypothetical protein
MINKSDEKQIIQYLEGLSLTSKKNFKYKLSEITNTVIKIDLTNPKNKKVYSEFWKKNPSLQEIEYFLNRVKSILYKWF